MPAVTAAKEPDPYICDERALLYAARGNAQSAERFRSQAKTLRDGTRR